MSLETPGGWRDFPGLTVSGGQFKLLQSSGASCRQMCQLMTHCQSASFDVRSGTCWILYMRECETARLVFNENMYHMVKNNGIKCR